MNYISESAHIGKNVIIGEFVVIEGNVVIGDSCIIGHNVVIHSASFIGKNVRIDDNSIIGKMPMIAEESILKDETLSPAVVCDGCLIGAGVIIYAGSYIGEKSMVADLATIREKVSIGSSTIIGRGCAIENCCSIGCRCKLETNSYITALSHIGDNAFIAPGVVTSNDNYTGRSDKRFESFKGVIVKNGGRIGANATVLPGRTIEEDGFAAAGSVVTKNVKSGTIVAGSPAAYLKNVPDDQLLYNQKTEVKD